VRCGVILLQRGNTICVVFPPPSLGVSSLDLGRLFRRRPFFLGVEAIPAVHPGCLGPILLAGLLGGGPVGLQLLERQGGEVIRDRDDIGRDRIEPGGAFVATLVHI